MASLFISYSRKDIESANQITAAFKNQGLDFWIDWEGIPPTVDWWKEIEKGIEEADIFLFLLSPDSATSPICKRELEHAAKNGKRLIPVVVRDVKTEECPAELQPLNWIFLRPPDDFQAGFQKLITAIQTDYEWAQAHRQLQVKALEWQRNAYESGFLLRGKELRDAETQLALNSSKEPHPTDLQREYVLKSRHATDRQRRTIISAGVVVLIIVAALAVYGFVQAGLARTAEATAVSNQGTAQAASTLALDNAATAQANAQEAEKQKTIALARQLAAQSQLIFSSQDAKLQTAVLLAVQSERMFPNSDAAQILQNDTLAQLGIHLKQGVSVEVIAFSPDGKYLASGGCDKQSSDRDCVEGSARVWDVTTGKQVARMTHTGAVTSLGFSPDGSYLVSGGGTTASVWMTSSGQKVSSLEKEVVNFVAFSPDAKRVATVAGDTLYIWDASDGQEISHMSKGSFIYFSMVAFSPDGKYVASASENAIDIWDAFTGQSISYFSLNNPSVYSVAFSPNGRYLASGSGDGTHVWDLVTGAEIIHIPVGGLEHVGMVAFSPNGEYLLSGVGIFHLERAIAWDITTNHEISRMIYDSSLGFLQGAGGPLESRPSSAAFRLDNRYVISGGCDKLGTGGDCAVGSARVWEVTTGREVARRMYDAAVNSVAFSPDGSTVASAGKDGTIDIWRPDSVNAIVRVSHASSVYSVAFSPDSQYAASGGGDGDGTVRVWKVASGQETSRALYHYWISFLAFSPDGRLVLSGEAGTGHLWEAATGKERFTVSQDLLFDSVDFSPDGKLFASGGCDKYDYTGCLQGSARLWDTNTGKEISQLPTAGSFDYVAFSPDGKYVLVKGCDDFDSKTQSCRQASSRLWDPFSGQEVYRIANEVQVNAVRFSPDGKWLASAGCDAYDFEARSCTQGSVRIWDARTGQAIATVVQEGWASSVAFSPDGKLLASAGCDTYDSATKACTQESVRIWDTATEKEVSHLTSDSSIDSVVFAQNGQYVVAGGETTIRIWDLKTGQEIVRVTNKDHRLEAFVISPDGKYVASGYNQGNDKEGVALAWIWRPEDLIADACARLTRNLSRAEWNQYIGSALPYQAVCPNLPLEAELTPTPIVTVQIPVAATISATPTQFVDITPTAGAVETFIQYSVQPGDTLTSIAQRFNLPVEVIVQDNHIQNGDQINIGQILNIRVSLTATAGPAP